MRLLIVFFVGVISNSIFSQHVRIATIRDNGNVKRYLQQVDSSAVLVNFAKIERWKWKSELRKCHGVLLSGGADIHPKRYGKPELVGLCELEEKRDEQEWRLLTLAAQDSLPIFGICRGMQFINVFFGGSLCPDFNEMCPRVENIAAIHRDPMQKKDLEHAVMVNTESTLFALFQSEFLKVNSWHHQSIERLAEDFLVSAVADDGTIEGIEKISGTWLVMGVQWHPERYYQEDIRNLTLLKYFLSYCTRR